MPILLNLHVNKFNIQGSLGEHHNQVAVSAFSSSAMDGPFLRQLMPKKHQKIVHPKDLSAYLARHQYTKLKDSIIVVEEREKVKIKKNASKSHKNKSDSATTTTMSSETTTKTNS